MNPADMFSHETDLVKLAPGAVLFEAGQPADAMYVVLEGALEILIDKQVVDKPVRGDIIGEMALIDAAPRSATVVAREAASLARVDSVRFQRLIERNPFFAMHVMKVLVSRVRRMDHVREQQKNPAAHG